MSIKLIPMEKLYKLAQEASIEYNGISVTVPANYEYDGASIPEPFWQIMGSPFYPGFMEASLFHDYLYTTHEQKKEFADDLFHFLLKKNGIGDIEALAMYDAVRIFGQSHWDQK